jgi:hypothetical protein
MIIKIGIKINVMLCNVRRARYKIKCTESAEKGKEKKLRRRKRKDR